MLPSCKDLVQGLCNEVSPEENLAISIQKIDHSTDQKLPAASVSVSNAVGPVALWNETLGVAEVREGADQIPSFMGYSDGGDLYLFVEEVMYLHERGMLTIILNKDSTLESVERVMSSLYHTSINMNIYKIYCMFLKLGHKLKRYNAIINVELKQPKIVSLDISDDQSDIPIPSTDVSQEKEKKKPKSVMSSSPELITIMDNDNSSVVSITDTEYLEVDDVKEKVECNTELSKQWPFSHSTQFLSSGDTVKSAVKSERSHDNNSHCDNSEILNKLPDLSQGSILRRPHVRFLPPNVLPQHDTYQTLLRQERYRPRPYRGRMQLMGSPNTHQHWDNQTKNAMKMAQYATHMLRTASMILYKNQGSQQKYGKRRFYRPHFKQRHNNNDSFYYKSSGCHETLDYNEPSTSQDNHIVILSDSEEEREEQESKIKCVPPLEKSSSSSEASVSNCVESDNSISEDSDNDDGGPAEGKKIQVRQDLFSQQRHSKHRASRKRKFNSGSTEDDPILILSSESDYEEIKLIVVEDKNGVETFPAKDDLHSDETVSLSKELKSGVDAGSEQNDIELTEDNSCHKNCTRSSPSADSAHSQENNDTLVKTFERIPGYKKMRLEIVDDSNDSKDDTRSSPAGCIPHFPDETVTVVNQSKNNEDVGKLAESSPENIPANTKELQTAVQLTKDENLSDCTMVSSPSSVENVSSSDGSINQFIMDEACLNDTSIPDPCGPLLKEGGSEACIRNNLQVFSSHSAATAEVRHLKVSFNGYFESTDISNSPDYALVILEDGVLPTNKELKILQRHYGMNRQFIFSYIDETEVFYFEVKTI